ncbi:phosphopantetheine-binding protein [Streptomyces pseudovenezuelae]|uniref:phosphopantetheine-binding protein n=1 Tax=Streptomyces pseudovenezuelae TaxID=67350 RepID=UPI0037163792
MTAQQHAPWDERFEQILRNNLKDLAASVPLVADVSLPDLGLNSVQTVSLLMELEETYEINLPEEAMVYRTFSTPGTLWQVIAPLVTQHGKDVGQ